MTLDEKDNRKIKELFSQFDTDDSGTISIKEIQNMLQKIGIRVSSGQAASLVKKVDLDETGMLDFDEFTTLVKLAISTPSSSGPSSSGSSGKSGDLSGEDAMYLRSMSSEFFSLIKKLWSRASDEADLNLIRSNYGVQKLSSALAFKNSIAVKGAAAVLLYLSIPDRKTDFIDESFYENLAIALENKNNENNFLWLSRLLRLLQMDKAFGDWMLQRSALPTENKVWKQLFEITRRADSEELKKESSRAVKEGSRAGLAEGQYCIIPEKVQERLKKEILWAITDEDIEELDKLAASSPSFSSIPYTAPPSYSTPPSSSSSSRSRGRSMSNDIDDLPPPSSDDLPPPDDDLPPPDDSPPDTPPPFPTPNYPPPQSVTQSASRSSLPPPPPVSAVASPMGMGLGAYSSSKGGGDQEARIRELQNQRDDIESEYLRKLQSAIEELVGEIRSLKNSNAAKDATVADLQREVSDLKTRFAQEVQETVRSVEQTLLDTVRSFSGMGMGGGVNPGGYGASNNPLALSSMPLAALSASVSAPLPNPNAGLGSSNSRGLSLTIPSYGGYPSSNSASAASSSSYDRNYGYGDRRAPPLSASFSAAGGIGLGRGDYPAPPLSASYAGASSASAFPAPYHRREASYSAGDNRAGGGGFGGGFGGRSQTVSPGPPPVEEMPLPPGWEKKLDARTNRYYYFERSSRRTQWKPPQ